MSLPVFDDLPGRRARLAAAYQRLSPALQLPTQAIGRRYAIGCVAVEVTQRCNLDCTLCYLSESSEKVKDIPIALVLERLRLVRETYGDGTSVQITGGDPTLRDRKELVAIVREAARLGLEPALMTNGIRLTRDLAQELRAAGLMDVAIHVDLTQERKGYPTEESLNAVRREYIERVRGLGFHVIFNTTVYDGNVKELPALIRFFRENADVVSLVSFQIQAETGRGAHHGKTDVITLAGVRKALSGACEADLSWDNIRVGHPDCNSVAFTLVADGRILDLNREGALYAELIRRTTDLKFSRIDAVGTATRVGLWALGQPRLMWLVARGVVDLLARGAGSIWRGRKGLRKLTIIIHNFMDATALDPERIHNCSFMVATDKGFVSMCAHNAARETFIRRPVALETSDGRAFWDPLSGKVLPAVNRPVAETPGKPASAVSLTLPVSEVQPSALSQIPIPPGLGAALPSLPMAAALPPPSGK